MNYLACKGWWAVPTLQNCYGISIAFVVHSLDRSLSTRLILLLFTSNSHFGSKAYGTMNYLACKGWWAVPTLQNCYGISIAFVVHSLDRSLSIRLILLLFTSNSHFGSKAYGTMNYLACKGWWAVPTLQNCYGISIAFVVHSLDRSLSIRLILLLFTSNSHFGSKSLWNHELFSLQRLVGSAHPTELLWDFYRVRCSLT